MVLASLRGFTVRLTRYTTKSGTKLKFMGVYPPPILQPCPSSKATLQVFYDVEYGFICKYASILLVLGDIA